MHWDVVDVRVKQNLTLEVRFSDDTEGIVRFMPKHLTGVFKPLKDPKIFKQVFIEDGVVTWPGEIDLAPDAMYKEIKQQGEWVLS